MAKLTRERAWCDAFERTKGASQVHSTREPTELQQRLQDLLSELSQHALPIEAIYQIADAVECAWQIGRCETE
jgi:hypothetical protein